MEVAPISQLTFDLDLSKEKITRVQSTKFYCAPIRGSCCPHADVMKLVIPIATDTKDTC